VQRNFNESEIFQSASPAQKILWNFISLRFGNKISVSQFYFCGRENLLNEINLFQTHRIFVCYQLNGNWEHNSLSNTDLRYVGVYNENNIMNYKMTNGVIIYNTTIPALQSLGTWIHHENFYFSRLQSDVQGNVWYKFIGFRVSY
jgi:hypothetical protein